MCPSNNEVGEKKVVHVEKVKIVVTAYGEKTSANEMAVYGSAVKFVAYWIQKQDGALDMTTEDLFEEFKGNVCIAMMGEIKGTG